MRRWSDVADAVAATTKTSEKTSILAAYLGSLDPVDLPVAAAFLTGRPFPESDQRTLGIGWSGIAGAVLRVAGAPPDALGRAYDRSSDIATAVTEVLTEAGHSPDPAAEPSVAEVRETFEQITATAGARAQGGAARGRSSRVRRRAPRARSSRC